MKNNFYLPILKSKQGEFVALSKLSPLQMEFIAPLFEVTPLEWDHAERKKPRTWEEHLDSFCKKFVTKWKRNNCFIDTSLLNWEDEDNTYRISYIFDNLSAHKLLPVPVSSLTTSIAFDKAFKYILKQYNINEIALRVNSGVVTDPEFENKIIELLTDLQIKPQNTHLIFDLEEPDFSEPEDFVDSLISILEDFPFLSEWRTFTIAGTSFPSSSTIKEGTWAFNRNEWKFYQSLIRKLKTTNYERGINYGDYSIVNPTYFEFNPKIMSASANIRYTHNDQWIVAKGKALKNKTAYTQYIALASTIVASKYYLGEKFSDGDSHLAKCVRREEGPGSPSIWIWVGNNHHFTKVLQDLFSIPPVS